MQPRVRISEDVPMWYLIVLPEFEFSKYVRTLCFFFSKLTRTECLEENRKHFWRQKNWHFNIWQLWHPEARVWKYMEDDKHIRFKNRHGYLFFGLDLFLNSQFFSSVTFSVCFSEWADNFQEKHPCMFSCHRHKRLLFTEVIVYVECKSYIGYWQAVKGDVNVWTVDRTIFR